MAKPKEDNEFSELIRKIRVNSNIIYYARKIKAELESESIHASERTVGNYMKSMCITCIYRQKYKSDNVVQTQIKIFLTRLKKGK